jgi:hypothetical protein
MTKLTTRSNAGIVARSINEIEKFRLRNSNPAEPRKIALNKVRRSTVVTG